MTIVNVDLRHPTQGGTDAPKNGYLECAPTKRRNLGDWVTLPERFAAKLVDGKAVLDLAPTADGTWAWRITERTNAGARRLVAVPSSGPVEYGDLQDVDPDTLDPTTPVTPVWAEFIHDQIAEAIDGILDGAPAAMDTLAELAAALGDDPNFATTVLTALAGKVDTATFTTALNALSATVAGKASQAALDAESATRAASDQATQGELTGRLSDTSLTAKIGQLKAWAKNPDQLVAGAITYTSGLLSSAVVEWPDGKPGVLTIDSRQSGTDAVTAFHVTHVDGATTLTYTQPTITRDSSGNATTVPQITVA